MPLPQEARARMYTAEGFAEMEIIYLSATTLMHNYMEVLDASHSVISEVSSISASLFL